MTGGGEVDKRVNKDGSEGERERKNKIGKTEQLLDKDGRS